MELVITTAMSDVLKSLGLSEVDFVVEHPSELSHGDYACNVAMVAAQTLSKNPRELAEEIVSKLEGEIEYVEKIEVAGPGFINFYLHRDFFAEETSRVLKQGDTWGRNESLKGQKVLVEYTDPNPFKEFHVGHLFTNSVGESISRLIEFSGADTKRLCYQGDVGMHVAHALWGMQQLGMTPRSGFTARDLGVAYAKGATAYKEDKTAQEEIKILNKKVYERTDEEVNALYDAGREVSLAYFESIYETIGTSFDHKFFESEAGPKGKELVLEHPEIFIQSNGAYIFDGESHGLHTRVFINAEGLPTYEAKELALAKMKEDELGVYDHSIVSTSNEITEYFKVLKKAMSFVYPDLAEKTEHIGHGTVRLKEGKMSSRTGQVIAATDFIDAVAQAATEKMSEHMETVDAGLARAVAIGAIKYTTLKGNILQDSVFVEEQALSFEGASGPYLQYTHARICSVLANADAAGVTLDMKVVPETPYEIEKVLYRFPEVIESATQERAPHQVVTYLTELASMFNSFYAQEKIADADDEFAPYKVLLSRAVGQTLKNGLYLLGIQAPERM